MSDTQFFMGQGSIYIASRDSTGQTSGFEPIGDADALAINTSQTFLDINESESGNLANVKHIPTQTTFAITMNVKNINGDNLKRAFYGSNTVNTAGSVTAEAVTIYNGEMSPVKHPGISSVVVKISSGATTLVLDTDYTVDAKNGTVTILSGSTLVVAGTPQAATIDYSYTANNVVEANLSTISEYVIRFEGINVAEGAKAVIVTMHTVALDMSSTLDLIGTAETSLSLGGVLNPDNSKGTGKSAYFQIVQAA